MKVEKYDGSRERRILTSMIVDKTVLGRITSKWERDMFLSPWSNLLGSWCVDYYKRYGKPPNKSIENVFASWQEKHADKDSATSIQNFLEGLSGEYSRLRKEVNSEHVIDTAGEYFNRVRLQRLANGILGDLDIGHISSAEEKATSYLKVQMGLGSTVDLLNDEEEIDSTFDGKKDDLIKYKEGLGAFFLGSLRRENLVAFLAPEKTGKTFWLIEVAWKALLQRKKVIFFECGDMSKQQIKERFYVRASRHPIRSKDGNWPYSIRYPVSIEASQKKDEIAVVEFGVDKIFEKPLNKTVAKAACRRIMENQVKSKESYFKLATYPTSTINVQGIRSVLRELELNGWVPDVVVVDYADILAPPIMTGRPDVREQINQTWKELRNVSIDLHCLVITATQSDAAGYDKWVLRKHNFSEDKRKLSHVNGIVGINVTPEEKDLQIFRLNWIALREGEAGPNKCCYVAGCLPLASPAICSVFP